jgi:hypothetical protein
MRMDSSNYFTCDCFTPEHLIAVHKLDDDIYLHVQLFNCYDKYKAAMDYLIDNRSKNGMFAETILRRNKKEFKDLFGATDEEPSYREECRITDPNYSFTVSYDIELEAVIIHASLSYEYNVFKRCWKTLKYLLKDNKGWHEWELSATDIQKIRKVCKLA